MQSAFKLAMVAAALSPGWVASANIEKWVDASGRVHYGDQAPPWASATPVIVQPNVIETDPVAQPATAVKRSTSSMRPKRSSNNSDRQRAEIQSYIELCRANRGIDCEHEARAMIDGPATVLFPGDPLVFPRPDLNLPSPPPPPETPVRF